MRKILVMVSVLTLGITNLNVLAHIRSHSFGSNFEQNSIVNLKSQKEESIFQDLNWKEIKTAIDEMFNTFFLNKNSKDEEEMLQAAKIKALEYLGKFENKEASYESVIADVKNEHQDFKKEYEKEWDKDIGLVVSADSEDDWVGGPKGGWLNDWMGGYKGQWLGSSGVSWTKPPIKEWIEPPLGEWPDAVKNGSPFYLSKSEESRNKMIAIFNSIETIELTAASLSAAAGVAAAAFFALSWAGGITFVYAVAATTASATLGVCSATIAFFLRASETELLQLHTAPLDIAWTVGKGLIMLCKTVMLANSFTTISIVTSTSWAVPFVFAVVGVLTGVVSWLIWAKVID